MGIALWVLLVGAGAAVALFGAFRAWLRRSRLARFAAQFGLRYSPQDPFPLIDGNFDLFTLQSGAGCRNVVWGEWQGTEVRAGELWFKGRPPEWSLSEWAMSGLVGVGSADRYSFAMVDLPAYVPEHIAIRRKPSITRRPRGLQLHPLRFESERFNHRFDVHCDDREAAWKFVDVRMEQWLLEANPRFEFEASARCVLVYSRLLKPMELVPLLGTAKAFRDHVPRMVLREGGPVDPAVRAVADGTSPEIV